MLFSLFLNASTQQIVIMLSVATKLKAVQHAAAVVEVVTHCHLKSEKLILYLIKNNDTSRYEHMISLSLMLRFNRVFDSISISIYFLN